jgi:hypothetical protein
MTSQPDALLAIEPTHLPHYTHAAVIIGNVIILAIITLVAGVALAIAHHLASAGLMTPTSTQITVITGVSVGKRQRDNSFAAIHFPANHKRAAIHTDRAPGDLNTACVTTDWPSESPVWSALPLTGEPKFGSAGTKDGW